LQALETLVCQTVLRLMHCICITDYIIH
jgi:hypothetical protein